MATVNSILLFQAFEARGYAIGSPQIQIEASGTSLNTVLSPCEALKGLMPFQFMAFESTSDLIISSLSSAFEALLSVRRVF